MKNHKISQRLLLKEKGQVSKELHIKMPSKFNQESCDARQKIKGCVSVKRSV